MCFVYTEPKIRDYAVWICPVSLLDELPTLVVGCWFVILFFEEFVALFYGCYVQFMERTFPLSLK